MIKDLLLVLHLKLLIIISRIYVVSAHYITQIFRNQHILESFSKPYKIHVFNMSWYKPNAREIMTWNLHDVGEQTHKLPQQNMEVGLLCVVYNVHRYV